MRPAVARTLETLMRWRAAIRRRCSCDGAPAIQRKRPPNASRPSSGNQSEGVHRVGNVWRVLKRDIIRLLKSPATLIVAIVLVILPSTYTWFNVIGFWNPYDNTGNLRVCVVDQDQGASTELTGEMNLGSQIEEQLHENTSLDWYFTDYNTALDMVQSGKAYAAYIIPSDFTSDFTTLLTGDFTQPQIQYYVNEKANPVSPKITDTGANTLDQTVNSTIVATVSGVVGTAVDQWVDEAQGKVDGVNSTVVQRATEADDALNAARTSVGDLNTAVDTANGKASDASTLVEGARGDLTDVSDALLDASALALATQNATGTFAASLSTALDDGSSLASSAALQTSSALGGASTAASAAEGRVDAALSAAQTVSDQLGRAIEELQAVQTLLPADSDAARTAADALARMQTQKAQYDQMLADASAVSTDVSDTADALSNVGATTNDAVQSSLATGAGVRQQIASTTLPSLLSNLYQISASTSSLAGTVSNQQLVISQALVSLGQLQSTLSSLSEALSQTDSLLGDISTELSTAKSDFEALAAASTLSQLPGGGEIDSQKIASFMASPTTVETVNLYPLNAYGSAMAPLFMNLTLWIGVFMLLVILRQEVDDEGVPNLTLTQRYMARWLFFALLCVGQAAVCCAGCLFIGVQCANVPLFFLTAIVTSLTYLSIQYALALTLLHVGKGLCIIMVFAQIPGATGLYPIEMTPPFFRAIYPLMPFTYGINALRETIGGLYGASLFQMLGVLALFAASGFVLGLVVRPYMTNLNRMSAHQIGESDILNGEELQAPPRRFRFAQIAKALSHRDDFRERLQASRAKFLKHYPRLIRGAVIFGIVVPAVLTVVTTMSESDKVITLTMWLALFVLVLGFLIVVEHIRDYFEHEMALEGYTDEQLRELIDLHNGTDQHIADGALFDGALPTDGGFEETSVPAYAGTARPMADAAVTAASAQPAEKTAPVQKTAQPAETARTDAAREAAPAPAQPADDAAPAPRDPARDDAPDEGGEA
jgi:putative membrane protein